MVQPINATEITRDDMTESITDKLLAIRDTCRRRHGDLWPARRQHLLRYIALAMDETDAGPLAAALQINAGLDTMPNADPTLQLAILAAAVDYIEGECELPPLTQRDDDTRTDA